MLTEIIPLTTEGRVNIKVYFKPQDYLTMLPVLFKVDTGADLTTISKKALMTLGYTMEWIQSNCTEEKTRYISKAGGRSFPACFVVIPKINVLGREFLNWPLYIRKEPSMDFPNLLGINVLVHFDYKVNNTKGCFEYEHCLTPKIQILNTFDSQEVCSMKINTDNKMNRF